MKLNDKLLNKNFIKTDNTISSEDTYSCTYVNEHFGGEVLYSNTTGKNTGNITLSKSISNYSYIEIFGYSNPDTIPVSTKISSEKFNQIGSLFVFATDGNLYAKIINFSMSDKTITILRNRSWYTGTNGNGQYNAGANDMYIYKVIGYK